MIRGLLILVPNWIDELSDLGYVLVYDAEKYSRLGEISRETHLSALPIEDIEEEVLGRIFETPPPQKWYKKLFGIKPKTYHDENSVCWSELAHLMGVPIHVGGVGQDRGFKYYDENGVRKKSLIKKRKIS